MLGEPSPVLMAPADLESLEETITTLSYREGMQLRSEELLDADGRRETFARQRSPCPARSENLDS